MTPQPATSSWDDKNFEALDAYFRVFGDPNVKASENQHLSAWIQQQRDAFQRGVLPQEMAEKLQSIGLNLQTEPKDDAMAAVVSTDEEENPKDASLTETTTMTSPFLRAVAAARAVAEGTALPSEELTVKPPKKLKSYHQRPNGTKQSKQSKHHYSLPKEEATKESSKKRSIQSLDDNDPAASSDDDQPKKSRDRLTPRKKKKKKTAETSTEVGVDVIDSSNKKGGTARRSPRKRNKESSNPPAAAPKDATKKEKSPILAKGSLVLMPGADGLFDTEATVIAATRLGTKVEHVESQRQELLTDAEAVVCKLAHAIKHQGLGNLPKPIPGTEIRKLDDYGERGQEPKEGIVVDVRKAETRCVFTNGDEEWISHNDVTICAVAQFMFHATDYCLELVKSLGEEGNPIKDTSDILALIQHTRPRETKGVGTQIRRHFALTDPSGRTVVGSGWYNGKVVEVSRYSVKARFEPSNFYPMGYETVLGHEEVYACAMAYEMHKKPRGTWPVPSVGTRIRVKCSSGWYNGCIKEKKAKAKSGTSVFKVEFDDKTIKRKMSEEEVIVYANVYKNYRHSILGDDASQDDENDGAFNKDAPSEHAPSTSKSATLHNSATNKGSSFDDEKAMINQVIKMVKPAVGLKIRKLFEEENGQHRWYEGEIIEEVDTRNSRARIRFTDNQEQTLTFGEVRVGHIAYQYNLSGLPAPRAKRGTKISKRFDQGWWDGTVVAVGTMGPSYVLFDADDSECYMSDEEIRVMAVAYEIRRRIK